MKKLLSVFFLFSLLGSVAYAHSEDNSVAAQDDVIVEGDTHTHADHHPESADYSDHPHSDHHPEETEDASEATAEDVVSD